MRFHEIKDPCLNIFDYFPNNNIISESGFSRVVSALKNKEFAVLSAYRKNFDKKQNILRNRELRGILNNRKMGVYPLVGYWKECEDETINYDDCPEELLSDTVERSYLVPKPKNMDSEEFKDLITKLCQKYEQDGAMLRNNEGIFFLDNSGETSFVGNSTAFNKIAQGYSRYVRRTDIPFVFEGVEIPSTVLGSQMFGKGGLRVLPLHKNDRTKTWYQLEEKLRHQRQ